MKLNLGCGKKYIDGWINVDFYDDSKCDVTHDLEEFPWPWEDDSVSEIRIIHTLEHLGADWKVYIKILQEMYRVCEDDALIHVNAPSPWHWNYISDPTHVRRVTPDGLVYLIHISEPKRRYAISYAVFCLKKTKATMLSLI